MPKSKKKKKKGYPYYVTMTDKFMSGWGKARGKTNKFVLGCKTYKEALIVQRNAKDRSEMKYVNIRRSKPKYDKRHVLTSFRSKKTASTWFRKDRPFVRRFK